MQSFSQSVFSPNTGKYGPEQTSHLGTFRAVVFCYICFRLLKSIEINETLASDAFKNNAIIFLKASKIISASREIDLNIFCFGFSQIQIKYRSLQVVAVISVFSSNTGKCITKITSNEHTDSG